MRSNNLASQRGFSLIELLIVLLIVGVVTTFAVLQFQDARTDLERQRIAREFKVYLERARFDSVKRRADAPADQARITLNGPFSFTATLDFDEDRIISGNESRLVDFTQRSAARIQVTDTLNYPITIRFDQRGHVTARDNANNPVTPTFRICSDCSEASPDLSVIAVSTTGTVSVLRDDGTSVPLPTPSSANPTPTPVLNCYVLVNVNSNTCSTN